MESEEQVFILFFLLLFAEGRGLIGGNVDEDDSLAFRHYIFGRPFDGILAWFVFVDGDGDQSIPTGPPRRRAPNF